MIRDVLALAWLLIKREWMLRTIRAEAQRLADQGKGVSILKPDGTFEPIKPREGEKPNGR